MMLHGWSNNSGLARGHDDYTCRDKEEAHDFIVASDCWAW